MQEVRFGRAARLVVEHASRGACRLCDRSKGREQIKREQMDHTDKPDKRAEEEPVERPWIALNTTYDVEAWIDNYNRDLQRFVEGRNVNGYGICFYLAEGGEIFMHTTPDGDVLLDVTPDAEWAAPVITAATHVPAPQSQLWTLPGHVLTQLVLGLSSLIGSTKLVLQHDYRIRKRWK